MSPAINELPNRESGWDTTYQELAQIVVSATTEWLSRTEAEQIELIARLVSKLDKELPEGLKIYLVGNVDQPSEGEMGSPQGKLSREGINIYLTDELKARLTNESTEEAMKIIVSIAVDIVTQYPKIYHTFRDKLRNTLLIK